MTRIHGRTRALSSEVRRLFVVRHSDACRSCPITLVHGRRAQFEVAVSVPQWAVLRVRLSSALRFDVKKMSCCVSLVRGRHDCSCELLRFFFSRLMTMKIRRRSWHDRLGRVPWDERGDEMQALKPFWELASMQVQNLWTSREWT